MDRQFAVPASSAGSILRAPALGGMPRHERSARIRRLPGLTKRLTSDVVIPNGGFDTTLKGRRGRRRSDAVGANDRHLALIEVFPQIRGPVWMHSIATTRAPAATKREL